MAALGLADWFSHDSSPSGLCTVWAVHAQHQGCAYTTSPSPLGWEWARSRRKHSQDSWRSNWPEGIFHTRGCLLGSKSGGRATARGIKAPLPGKWLNIACWWKPFNFLCFRFINLHSSWPTRFFHLFYPPPHKDYERSDTAAWWALGIQPTHHSGFTHSSPHQKSHQKPYHRFVLRGHHPSHGLWCQHQQTVPSPGEGPVQAARKRKTKKTHL